MIYNKIRCSLMGLCLTGILLGTCAMAESGSGAKVLSCNPIKKDTTQPGWYERQPLPEPLSGHTVTLLPNGRVLVLGGQDVMDGSKNDASLRFGQVPATVPLTGNTWIYDVQTDCWSALTPMPEMRRGHTATTLSDGRILVTGGATPMLPSDNNGFYRWRAIHSAVIYDPQSDQWHPAAPMQLSRNSHQAILLPDGRVLVSQGIMLSRSGPMRPDVISEIYTPKTNTWQTLDMPEMQPATYSIAHMPRLHQVLWLANVGGTRFYGNPEAPRRVISYDYLKQVWVVQDDSSKPAQGVWTDAVTLVLPDNKVLVIGGNKEEQRWSQKTVQHDKWNLS